MRMDFLIVRSSRFSLKGYEFFFFEDLENIERGVR